MGADFKLVARGLVDMGRTQDVEALDAGGQGHRAANHCAGPLGGLDDFGGRLIDQLVVEGLEADANFLALHDISFKERWPAA